MYLFLLLATSALCFCLWAYTDNEIWMLLCMVVLAVIVTCAESLI